MRSFSLFFCLLIIQHCHAQYWQIDSMAMMPEAVSNNAVVEGWAGNTPYLFSFGGIDSSKIWSGIHLRSYRYNMLSNSWDTIPPLPDTLGKIAAAASRIGNIIYIVGGYHVFANGNEASSDRVHRYDINSNSYLSDGAAVPIPIDDQAQAVWRDSLIYVISGWSNTGNVPDIQIYNPAQDNWSAGTPINLNSNHRVFGAAAAIIEDTIYYYGGASGAFFFPAMPFLRKGIIDPADPNSISWSDTLFDNNLRGYRQAAISAYGRCFFIGGSGVSYNYNGIAYNNSGGVPPLKQILWYEPASEQWGLETGYNQLPMDLRGIAKLDSNTYFLAGGMENNQRVSRKCWKLTLDPILLAHPKPSQDMTLATLNNSASLNGQYLFDIFNNNCEYQVFDLKGKCLKTGQWPQGHQQLDLSNNPTQLYLVLLKYQQHQQLFKIIKL